MAVNPYLAQQGQAITDTANRNLMQGVLPQVNSGAMAAGGYGGSRHGLAQGTAIGLNQQGITNSLANLYGGAYENDQNRAQQLNIAGMQDATSRYGIDQSTGLGREGLANQYNIANMGNTTTMRGQDINKDLGMAGIGQQKYATDVGAATNIYGVDVGAKTATRGQDITRDLGYAGLGTQEKIAGMNADVTRRGQDVTRYGIDQSTGLGREGLANQYNIANMSDSTNRYGIDIGAQGNLRGQDITRELGMGNLYNNYNANATNAAQVGSNIYTSGLNNAITIGNELYGSGQREMNAPAAINTQYQQVLQGLLPATGSGTSQGPATGGGVAGALGGALTYQQYIDQLMGKRGP